MVIITSSEVQNTRAYGNIARTREYTRRRGVKLNDIIEGLKYFEAIPYACRTTTRSREFISDG